MSDGGSPGSASNNIENGAGVSLLQMRAGLFGKSAVTLQVNDSATNGTKQIIEANVNESNHDAVNSADDLNGNSEQKEDKEFNESSVNDSSAEEHQKTSDASKEDEVVAEPPSLQNQDNSDADDIATEELSKEESVVDSSTSSHSAEEPVSSKATEEISEETMEEVDDRKDTEKEASAEEEEQTENVAEHEEDEKTDITEEAEEEAGNEEEEKEAENEEDEENEAENEETGEEEKDADNAEEEKEAEDEEEDEPEEKTSSKKSTPRRRSTRAAPAEVQNTPVSTARKVNVRSTRKSSPVVDKKEDAPVRTPRGRPKVATSTPKTAAKSTTRGKPEAESATPRRTRSQDSSSNVKDSATKSKESTKNTPASRTPKTASKKLVATPSTTRSSRSKATQEKLPSPHLSNNESDEGEEEADEEKTPVKARATRAKPATSVRRAGRPRSNIAETKQPETPKTKKEAKVPQSAPPARATKISERDPYDMDTEMESHPEPLKHIEMTMQSFGDVSYSRVGAGKYEKTEKAAEARVSNLSELVPRSKNRKSLAELTPGNKRTPSTPRARKPVEDVPMDEDEDVKEVVKKTPGRKRKASNAQEVTSTKRAKESFPIPELDAEQLWTIDHPEDEHVPYEAGARVYAIYDKVYYPAIVLVSGKDNLGRYKVHFIEDNMMKDVPGAGVIPLRAVVAEKECMGNVNGEPKDMVVIKSPNAACAKEWKKAMFVVAELDEDENCDGPEISLDWTKISLDINDWKAYIDLKSRELTEVTTDNISTTSSRPRRSKMEDPTATPVLKTSTATPAAKSLKRGRAAKKTTPPPKLEKKPDNAEVYEGDNSDTDDDNALCSLFAGKVFILTSAQRSTTEGPAFKKKALSEFIEQWQGKVVEDFADVDARPDMEAYLISDTHYRTHKYLSAMARGVPCVSHEWINMCKEMNQLVDYKDHLLPAGVSILDKETYPLPSNQDVLLKDKVILVHTNNNSKGSKALNFVQIWEPMVKLLGGTPITSIDDKHSKLDIMLTDSSASPGVVEAAESEGAIIVSSEWLIQGIIMNKLPDKSAHPRFNHDNGTSR